MTCLYHGNENVTWSHIRARTKNFNKIYESSK